MDWTLSCRKPTRWDHCPFMSHPILSHEDLVVQWQSLNITRGAKSPRDQKQNFFISKYTFETTDLDFVPPSQMVNGTPAGIRVFGLAFREEGSPGAPNPPKITRIYVSRIWAGLCAADCSQTSKPSMALRGSDKLVSQNTSLGIKSQVFPTSLIADRPLLQQFKGSPTNGNLTPFCLFMCRLVSKHLVLCVTFRLGIY